MRAAWIDLYDVEYLLVIRFVMKAGPADIDDARDATQEAFLESWKLMHEEPEDWSRVNQRGWIRTVALRKYRRPPGPRQRLLVDLAGQRTGLPDRPTPGPDPGEFVAQAHAVLEALATLPPVQREVMAFLTDGFAPKNIAEQLDVSEQKVRDVARTARARLKRDLAAMTATKEGKESR